MTVTPLPRLAAALRAAERGWPVFPLYPYSKYPAVKDWGRRATCDPDEISRWWAAAPYNIGIVCGRAGLVVLDLDAARDRPPPPPWDALGVSHGRDVLRLLADRSGQPDPVDTYTVTTPRGEHRYFLAPVEPQLRNTTGDTGAGLGWLIDTRAAGGAVVAAGSVRRIDGTLHHYRALRDRDPTALPGWLVTALTPVPVPPPAPIPLPAPRPGWAPTSAPRSTAKPARSPRPPPAPARTPCSAPPPVSANSSAPESSTKPPPTTPCWTPPPHWTPPPTLSPAAKPNATSPTASPAAATTPAGGPLTPHITTPER